MGVGLVLHKVRVQGTRVKRLCSAKHNGISRVGNINGQSNAKHIRNPKGVVDGAGKASSTHKFSLSAGEGDKRYGSDN